MDGCFKIRILNAKTGDNDGYSKEGRSLGETLYNSNLLNQVNLNNKTPLIFESESTFMLTNCLNTVKNEFVGSKEKYEKYFGDITKNYNKEH